MKKKIKPNQLFYDDVVRLITNLLIDNVNYRNGHYANKSAYELRVDVIERSKYILEKLEQEKHLIGLSTREEKKDEHPSSSRKQSGDKNNPEHHQAV
jgi:hypothetical protein